MDVSSYLKERWKAGEIRICVDDATYDAYEATLTPNTRTSFNYIAPIFAVKRHPLKFKNALVIADARKERP